MLGEDRKKLMDKDIACNHLNLEEKIHFLSEPRIVKSTKLMACSPFPTCQLIAT